MKVYLVTGSCGSYADYSHWIAKAFTDRVRAEQHRERVQDEINRIQALPWTRRMEIARDPEFMSGYGKLDPNLPGFVGSDDVEYEVEDLEVEEGPAPAKLLSYEELKQRAEKDPIVMAVCEDRGVKFERKP